VTSSGQQTLPVRSQLLPQQQRQDDSQHQSPLEAESYSLRQFGINMDEMFSSNMNQQAPTQNMSVPHPSSYQPNTNMPQQNQQQQQQQQSTSSMILPINPADSFLFGLSDLSFPTSYNAPPVMPSYDTNTNIIPTTTSNTNNYPIQQPQDMIDQTVFRNRPDNPFWSVPSSIELDDWTAYLLPQQLPNSTAAPSSVPGQQQRGWNSSGWV
jgi:hypothetical protein